MATITRRKTGYQAEIRRKGYPPTSRMFDSRKEAEAWARLYEAEMDRGIYVSRKEAEGTTLLEALDRYEREITVSKKGAARERYRIKDWKKTSLAACYLASIRSTDVAQYRDQRIAQGASANTVRLELTLLSHVFTIAIKEWGMESLANPVAMIRLPRRPQGRERRVEQERGTGADELEEIIIASESPQLPVILRLAVETAMRRSEVIELTWSQINLTKRYLILNETKNGTRRIVPLSSRAIEVLGSLPRRLGTDRVFAITPKSASVLFLRTVRRARRNYERRMLEQGRAPDPSYLMNIRFHDLRHEATSRLFERGLNVMEVASITGHKTLAMLQRYTHLRIEDLVRKLA